MRSKSVLPMLAMGAMAAALCGQRMLDDGPPREFTNSAGMKLVRIMPSSFKLGGGDAGPVYDVTLSRGYYLQTTEVTEAQWQKVMGTDPSHFKGPDRPVESVSWDDIQEFLSKLNAMEKDDRYRLPTEAEWEYGCRAGIQEPDRARDMDAVAWTRENAGDQSHPVGQKKANSWGLYDMRGNVWEWVQNRQGEPSADRQVDPQGPASGLRRVMRGGAWNFADSFAACSSRCFVPSMTAPYDAGFRCARSF